LSLSRFGFFCEEAEASTTVELFFLDFEARPTVLADISLFSRGEERGEKYWKTWEEARWWCCSPKELAFSLNI
jgi:hypothetical protein